MLVWGVLLISVLAAVLLQHPFLTYPASLRLLSRRAAATPVEPTSELPSVSIMCCCHNEEAVIEQKIRTTLESLKPFGVNGEALFYLDACSDKTEELARQFDNEVTVIASAERSGKSVGMATLSALAKGEIFILTDANTFSAPEAIQRLAETFADPTVGCASARLLYDNSSDNDVTAISCGYWQFEERLKTLETERAGTTVSADGGLFALRRALYKPAAPAVIDDMFTSINTVFAGYRLVSRPEALAYEKTATELGDELRRKVRIACRAFNCFRLVRPQIHARGALFTYQFYSHKVIRWFAFPLLMLFGLSAWLVILLTIGWPVAVVLALVAVLMAAGGFAGLPGLALIAKAIRSTSATFGGVVLSLRGVKFQTWNSAASGR